MSVRIMTRVWDAPFPTASYKLVALKYADCADDHGRNVYPSVAYMQAATGLSASAVREAVADMEGAELLLLDFSRQQRARDCTTISRRFDLILLEALALKQVVWVKEDVPALDHRSEPKLDADGKPFMRKAWRLAKAVDNPVDNGGTPPTCGGSDPPQRGGDPSAGPSAGPSARPSAVRSLYKDDPLSTNSPLPPEGAERHEDGAGDATCEGGEEDGGAQGTVRGARDEGQPGESASADPWDVPAWSRAWPKEAIEAGDEIRASVTRSAVATSLLDEVAPLLGPPRDVDAAAYIRRLASLFGDTPAGVLSMVAARLLATRKRDLPAVADIGDLVRVEGARLAGAKARLAVAIGTSTPAGSNHADDLVEITSADPLFPLLMAEAQLAMEAINPAMARRLGDRKVFRIKRREAIDRRGAMAPGAQGDLALVDPSTPAAPGGRLPAGESPGANKDLHP